MSLFVDLLSTLSIVGIWPRFIEPKLLSTTYLDWELDSNCDHLEGIKIIQLTDLHFHQKTPLRFLKKIARRIDLEKPDIILFTGDFLCYSKLEEKQRLSSFLNQLKAPLGCFCTFGNHDYARYVTRGSNGVYDTLTPPTPFTGILRAFRAFFSKTPQKASSISESARSTPRHAELCELLQNTPFTFLENQTITLPIGLNISGLGDFSLGRCLPKETFQTYNPRYPGIVLSHNPDTFPLLSTFPGNWVLSGHTHGEQIHFPFPKWLREVSRKLARIDHAEYTRGLHHFQNKKIYINRGLGSHKPFRFCSIPEILVIQGKKAIQ